MHYFTRNFENPNKLKFQQKFQNSTDSKEQKKTKKFKFSKTNIHALFNRFEKNPKNSTRKFDHKY